MSQAGAPVGNEWRIRRESLERVELEGVWLGEDERMWEWRTERRTKLRREEVLTTGSESKKAVMNVERAEMREGETEEEEEEEEEEGSLLRREECRASRFASSVARVVGGLHFLLPPAAAAAIASPEEEKPAAPAPPPTGLVDLSPPLPCAYSSFQLVGDVFSQKASDLKRRELPVSEV